MKKQRLPYESAEDGLEALDKFKENSHKYFLILMDMVSRDIYTTPYRYPS
jgi:CheY-like chemotaxis protein